jgi:HEAT repeat protein
VGDPDELIRFTAIEALGSFHDPRITPVLFSALQDQSSVAIEAARTLGRRSDLLKSSAIIPYLQSCLLGNDAAVARESAIALGRLGAHPGGALATEALGDFLTQPAPSQVKVAAVRALGWIDSPAATHYLCSAFDSPFPLVMLEVRQEIARSLGQTQSAPLQLIAAQPLIGWLESQVNSQVEPLLDPLLNSPDQPDTFLLKQTVLSALARLGTLDGLDSIIPVLGDPDARIRMHALNALKQISPDIARAKIERYLSQETTSFALKQKIAESLSAW